MRDEENKCFINCKLQCIQGSLRNLGAGSGGRTGDTPGVHLSVAECDLKAVYEPNSVPRPIPRLSLGSASSCYVAWRRLEKVLLLLLIFL